MARIRSVHPGMFTDEAFVELSPIARIFYIGLLTECDDAGVFEWKPKTLNMRLFPADQVDVTPMLGELVEQKMAIQFDTDGKTYGVVRNFQKWQRPKKPTYRYPLPHQYRTFVGAVGEKPGNEPADGGGSLKEVMAGGNSNHIDKPVVVVVTREPEKPASTTTTTKAVDEVPKANPLGTPLPDDWTPNDHDQAVAASFGMEGAVVEEQLLQFHAYNASKGTFSPDWSATWFRWCSAWKLKQPKEPPRVQLSAYQPTEADWNSAAKIWAKSQRWSRHLGNEPGMGGCRCPAAILTAHGIDPATGMVKAVGS